MHGWLYSDTNYILLGMIIQKVTGRSPVTEISRRILVPLGLHDTSFPLTSKQIPAPYAHGYYGSLDATNLVSPSIAWTAGAMISTVDDVARFYRALLDGRLLPPAQQRELLATIPVNDTGELFAEHYGLGIYSVQLSCGTAWGHDGGIIGFKAFAYTSPDGNRQAVIVYNDYKKSVPPGRHRDGRLPARSRRPPKSHSAGRDNAEPRHSAPAGKSPGRRGVSVGRCRWAGAGCSSRPPTRCPLGGSFSCYPRAKPDLPVSGHPALWLP